jgi:hypothetical protein
MVCKQRVCVCDPPCAEGYHCGETLGCLPDWPEANAAPEAAAAPAPAPAPAREGLVQPPLPPPLARSDGARRHDGFMLRWTAGLGASELDAKLREAGDELEYTGLSASFGIDAGAAAIENVIVHGRIAGFALWQPDLRVNGAKADAGDRELLSFLIAPAATYYAMPLNVYATAAVGVSWIVYVDRSAEGDDATDPGIGVNFELGKEWWLNPVWGIGVAGRFWFTGLRDSSGDERTATRWTGFALLCSATYQ